MAAPREGGRRCRDPPPSVPRTSSRASSTRSGFCISELDRRARILGPRELRQQEILRADHPDSFAREFDASPARKLLEPERRIFADNEVDLHDALRVDQVEQTLSHNRHVHCVGVTFKLIAEQMRQPFSILWFECDDEIDVAGHAWLGIMTGLLAGRPSPQ